MEKVVKIYFDQGIDSLVRVTGYLRRKEIEVESLNMKRESYNNITLEIGFKDLVSKEMVINHLEKLHDVTKIEVV